MNLSITSLTGKVIWFKSVYNTTSELNTEVQMDGIANGLYILNIESDKGIKRKMIVVRK